MCPSIYKIVFSLLVCTSFVQAQPRPNEIRQVFDQIASETDWDLSKSLLWGYFFIHSEKEGLEKLGEFLVSQGYSLVSIHDVESADGNQWVLQVSEIERHDEASLVSRCDQLNGLAAEYGIDLFDGYDVGFTKEAKNGFPVQFWSYVADYDSRPGSIWLNLGIKSAAPLKDRRYLVKIRGSYVSAENREGLPTDAELLRLQELRARRASVLKQYTSTIDAGSFLLDGKQIQYLYVDNLEGVEDLLKNFHEENYSSYDFEVKIEEDADWDAYLKFLFPNQAIINFHEAELKKLGYWDLFSK